MEKADLEKDIGCKFSLTQPMKDEIHANLMRMDADNVVLSELVR
jgi:hypothetical protein